MNAGNPGTPSPTFSVLIGMVSTEDADRILQTLDSLRQQRGGHSYEVIIGDRRDDKVGRLIEQSYPEAKLFRCPASTALPELRTLALDRAAGQYIVVTEDHCVPAEDWLEGIARAFREAPAGTAAVAGCVENGVTQTSLDWATFLCEYSAFVAPVAEGPARALPGMNVAYERGVFEGLDRKVLTTGFWETTLHPALLDAGRTLHSTNSIRIYHCKKFSLGLFARQRFIYSRYYGGLRFGRGQWARKAIAIAATPALPALLLFRMARQVSAKRRLRLELLSALPYLAMFVIIWAWGELVGYALGAGDALERIE